MIQLKDYHIIDINTPTIEAYKFDGTFSPYDKQAITSIKLSLDNHTTVTLKSLSQDIDNEYVSTNALLLDDPSVVLKSVIKLIPNSSTLSIGDFIDQLLQQVVQNRTELIEIVVNDKPLYAYDSFTRFYTSIAPTVTNDYSYLQQFLGKVLEITDTSIINPWVAESALDQTIRFNQLVESDRYKQFVNHDKYPLAFFKNAKPVEQLSNDLRRLSLLERIVIGQINRRFNGRTVTYIDDQQVEYEVRLSTDDDGYLTLNVKNEKIEYDYHVPPIETRLSLIEEMTKIINRLDFKEITEQLNDPLTAEYQENIVKRFGELGGQLVSDTVDQFLAKLIELSMTSLERTNYR